MQCIWDQNELPDIEDYYTEYEKDIEVESKVRTMLSTEPQYAQYDELVLWRNLKPIDLDVFNLFYFRASEYSHYLSFFGLDFTEWLTSTNSNDFKIDATTHDDVIHGVMRKLANDGSITEVTYRAG